MKPATPKAFDGFGFDLNPVTKDVQFIFFDDVAKEYGQLPGSAEVPKDRERYHVLLSSTIKGRIHVERPFTSNFLDAFAYAEHVARSGFTGVMIRDNKYSVAVMEAVMLEVLTRHAREGGFVMEDDNGVDVFHEGLKTLDKA